MKVSIDWFKWHWKPIPNVMIIENNHYFGKSTYKNMKKKTMNQLKVINATLNLNRGYKLTKIIWKKHILKCGNIISYKWRMIYKESI